MAEIIACPSCRRQLQVPENFFGQAVQCPDCSHQFVAQPTAAAVPPGAPATDSAARLSRSRHDDDAADSEYPRRRRPRRYDDDEDDDDFDEGRNLRRHSMPHRGGLILALGLISLVGGALAWVPVILGPFAWVMGNRDLREIAEGRMDSSGESMTRAGQVCGIIATVILILALLFFGFICVVTVLTNH